MQLKKNYASLAEGETLVIKATDQAFGKDVASWCKITGAELTKLENQGGIVTAWVRKVKETDEPLPSCPSTRPAPATADHKTLIVFSDDLDRALASFVIANGAAAMGQEGHHVLYVLGTERHQEVAQAGNRKGYFRKDVWHDAAFQLQKAETF